MNLDGMKPVRLARLYQDPEVVEILREHDKTASIAADAREKKAKWDGFWWGVVVMVALTHFVRLVMSF